MSRQQKYKTIKDEVSSQPFGTNTELHYSDKLFPCWHLNQQLQIGDLVVYDARYYSVTATKKNKLQLTRVIYSHEQWVMASDMIKNKRLKKVSLYKRCLRKYNHSEYETFINDQLPKNGDIIASDKNPFVLLYSFENEDMKEAIKVLKEQVFDYINMRTRESVIGPNRLIDHILVLMTQ